MREAYKEIAKDLCEFLAAKGHTDIVAIDNLCRCNEGKFEISNDKIKIVYYRKGTFYITLDAGKSVISGYRNSVEAVKQFFNESGAYESGKYYFMSPAISVNEKDWA